MSLKIGNAIKASKQGLEIEIKNLGGQPVMVSPWLEATFSNSDLFAQKKIFTVAPPGVIGAAILFVGSPKDIPVNPVIEGQGPREEEIGAGQSILIDFVSKSDLAAIAKKAINVKIFFTFNHKIIMSAPAPEVLTALQHIPQ